MNHILIFVYGTLKKGYRNHHYLQDATYYGEGTLVDYEMFDLGTYPGIRYKEAASVDGELYLVNELIKKDIDMLEEEGTLYRCIKVEVKCNHQTLQALVYEYLPEYHGEVLKRTSW